MDTTLKEIDARDEIVAKLKDDGRTFSWLTKKLDMNYNTFYATFVHKTINLKPAVKDQVNEILGTSF